MLIVIIAVGFLYSAPNLYGEDPSVQISAKGSTVKLTADTKARIVAVLQADGVPYKSITRRKDKLLVRFAEPGTQLKAKGLIKDTLGENYIVALNLAPRTPTWLRSIGAKAMKLGLDLRGGVHFLLDVDVNAVLKARETEDIRSMGKAMRKGSIRYSGISRTRSNGVVLHFRDAKNRSSAKDVLQRQFTDYTFVGTRKGSQYLLNGVLTQKALTDIRNYAIEQNMTILRTRVNELGISEAIVQQQGLNQISVDLPGVQDTTRAQDIIGKTATLRFQMVDTTHDAQSVAAGGAAPVGTRLFRTEEGRPVLLKNQVILRGNDITFARAGVGDDGRPNVSVRLGSGVATFQRATTANVGKPMAVIYVETKPAIQIVNGKKIKVTRQTEKIISIATIIQPLSNRFQITGLESLRYSQNLALLLRSGALAAPVVIASERTVGPSLGEANIAKGILSVEIGSLLVVLFMLLYYRLFGMVANLALMLNIVLIVAVLSILGATLTLPGIAAIVLTVGMAVDANVLINERIREELRNGMSPNASIQAGYDRAFVTIVDANVTTLIVALVLFALGGSSSVKGFAVVLIVGLTASMLTSIVFTRAVVSLIYGRRKVRHLSIGIKVKH